MCSANAASRLRSKPIRHALAPAPAAAPARAPARARARVHASNSGVARFVNSGIPFRVAAVLDSLVLVALCVAGWAGQSLLSAAQAALARKAAVLVAIVHVGTGLAAARIGAARGLPMPQWQLFVTGYWFGYSGVLYAQHAHV